MLFSYLRLRFFFTLLLTTACCAPFAQGRTGSRARQLKTAQIQKNYLTDTANVTLLNRLADKYLYNNADSSLNFAKQALRLANAQKFVLGQARSWNNISKVYYVMGNYVEALDASQKLFAVSNRLDFQYGIASAYQMMGLVYMAQDKNDAALTEFKKALRISVQIKDISKEGTIYFDIGVCHDESGRADSAFYYLCKATAIAMRVNDKNLLSMILNRKGEIYFHLKNYSKALGFYTQVTGLEAVSKWELDFAYSGIAQCDYGIGKYKDALANAQKSYAIPGQVNSAFDAIRAMEILSESFAATNNYKQAYKWQQRLKKSNDSVFDQEKEKQVNYLQLKQQQADNQRLENEIKNKENSIAFAKRLLFFRNMIAVITVIFFIFVFINNRQKTALNKVLKQQNDDIAQQKEELSRQKEGLDQINQTKDQLFAIISHDLRSPFATLAQSIQAIRAGDITAEEQDELMDNFYLQVNRLTNMLNNLLAWANSQQAGITSKPASLEITRLVDDIVSFSDFPAKNKKITITHLHDSEQQVWADPDHVRIIIQNLIGNAIKFTREGGTITIYYSDEGDKLAIHIKDNGVGMSSKKMERIFKVTGKEISGHGTNNEAGAGIGLALIKQFSDANNGRLEVKSKTGEGSEFTVYLPKA